MSRLSWLLRSLTVNSVMACAMFGTAIGVTNVLVNHIHWLGAYLIACPAHGWTAEPAPSLPAAIGTFVEEHGFFDVTINGETVRLQGMTVKRADLTGRLPIALIAHGMDSSLANVRSLAAKIEIYTIGFLVVDDQRARDLLSQCATDASHYYIATDGTALESAFRDIALKIATLRLTN